jgi:hypothetical protein
MEVTNHRFQWEENDQGHVVGNDVIQTNITETTQILYSDGTRGSNCTYIHYTATINRYGQATNVTMNYWSNTNGEIFTTNAEIKPDQAPEDFKTLFNAAYSFKNNPSTRQKSFIQHIADNNKETNSTVGGVTTIVGAIGSAIQYIPGASKVAGKIVAGLATLARVTTNAINSEDPTKITIYLSQPNLTY